jgi:hypothetical protein
VVPVSTVPQYTASVLCSVNITAGSFFILIFQFQSKLVIKMFGSFELRKTKEGFCSAKIISKYSPTGQYLVINSNLSNLIRCQSATDNYLSYLRLFMYYT